MSIDMLRIAFLPSDTLTFVDKALRVDALGGRSVHVILYCACVGGRAQHGVRIIASAPVNGEANKAMKGSLVEELSLIHI
eukprot:566466-Alexandrium_andersonii.AAC.1